MKIIENTNVFDDKMQPGAFIGATLVASGVKNSVIVYHGYLGCNIECIHMRSDSIPGGFYTPIIPTGLNESDSVYGGFDKLKRTVLDLCNKKPEIIWILTGDATSITADDIYSIVNLPEMPPFIKVIPLDVPGFLGGIAAGTDVALTKLFNSTEDTKAINDTLTLVAPHLMGIKSHPQDIIEIKSLLERSNMPVEKVLCKDLQFDDIKSIKQSRRFLPLTWESMPNFKSECINNGSEFINHNLPLPIGIANTELWLLEIAKMFNKTSDAKSVLLKDKDIVKNQLKFNYNYSWLSTLFTEKTCCIYGYSQFAVSLAACLFYDFNIKPRVIAIVAETDEAIQKSKSFLKELSQYTDFDLLINPDYYTYIKHAKSHNVDFAIGSIQDKPLCVGENIPHMSLGGYYFFNNYNFIPWPYLGVKGVLSLLTEFGFLMEKAFYYENYWKEYSFNSSKNDI